MIRSFAIALGLASLPFAASAQAGEPTCPEDAFQQMTDVLDRIGSLPADSGRPEALHGKVQSLYSACPGDIEVQLRLAMAAWLLIDFEEDPDGVARQAVFASNALRNVESRWMADDAAERWPYAKGTPPEERAEAQNEARASQIDLAKDILQGFVVKTMFERMLDQIYDTGFDGPDEQACPYASSVLLAAELKTQYDYFRQLAQQLDQQGRIVPGLPNAYRLNLLRDRCEGAGQPIAKALAEYYVQLAELAQTYPDRPLPDGSPAPDNLAAELAEAALSQLDAYDRLPARSESDAGQADSGVTDIRRRASAIRGEAD
ncbi:hypothetical protein D1224_09315 [Henriciella barbarensis]|uniref:Uncharacterized protein n=1 Tax=Henriciella barbarensis TaxID=86342 RepID=A0A399R2H6_9PROT|nr:hypothetical protein [Henriciella barbarensis]RIJ24415.1 hypothetical protein D1224_09315 [Henriciella barbarensis]